MAITDIKDIFDNVCAIKPQDNELIIKESDNSLGSSTLKKIKIKNLNDNELACYKLDKHVPLTKYFNSTNSTGINKGVDAVLFYKKEDVGYILFIELKSYSLKKKDVANKYFASTAFIHQVSYLLKNIYNKNILDYKSSAIVFSLNSNNNRVQKFGMRPDIPTYNNKNYSNTKKSIQVLEIQKNNGSKFNVSIENILEKARHKPLKNWP